MDEVGGDSVIDEIDANGRADPEIEEIESSTRDVSVVASFSMSISINISLVIVNSPLAGCIVLLNRVVALGHCCSCCGEGQR